MTNNDEYCVSMVHGRLGRALAALTGRFQFMVLAYQLLRPPFPGRDVVSPLPPRGRTLVACLVRDSVWRDHLSEGTRFGLPWSAEGPSSPVWHRYWRSVG